MNDIPSEILARLDEKLARLNSFRPLLQTPVDKLREQFELEMTYNSNAIEGNSLTQKKTFLVINEGLPPLKDHLEAKGHTEALEYLSNLTSKKYLNLLARTGKFEVHKEGRIWLSSKEALKRYMDGRERNRK